MITGLRSVILACLAALLCCSDREEMAARPLQDKPTVLLPDERVSKRLDGEVAYTFNLKPGQYFGLSLQKPGTDIALSLLQPDGKLMRSIDCAHDGPLQIAELGAAAGSYSLRLRTCANATGPAYELILSISKNGPAADRLRVDAERLSAEADSLVAQYSADARRTATRKYESAASAFRSAGSFLDESMTLSKIARLYRDLGEPANALSYVEKARGAARSDALSEAESLIVRATIQLNQGETSNAISSVTRALDLIRSTSNRKAEQEALNLLGFIRYDRSEYVEATTALEDARRIALERGSRLGLARATLDLSAVDFDQLRFGAARDKAQEALALFGAVNDRQGQAKALIYLGHYLSALNRKDEALSRYQEAKPLATGSGDFYTEASLFSGIARTHLDLGNTKAALQFYKLALDANRALGDRIGAAYTLRSIGHCYFAQDDTRQALDSLNQSLAIFHDVSQNREAYVLQDIGIVMEKAGNTAGALEHLNRALKISLSEQGPDQRLEAWSRTGIGHVYEAQGNIERALEYYEDALRINEKLDRLGWLTVQYRIAECLRRTNRLQEARLRSEKSLEEIERFRSSVANTGLRTSYFASVQQQYDLYIDLLMQLRHEKGGAGLDVRALETSEASRARTLVDSIAENHISISEGVDAKEIEREATLRVLLDSKINQLGTAGAKAKQELSDEIERLSAEHELVKGQIRVRSPRYAELVQPRPLTLPQIQEQLSDDSILLEYKLGNEHSYLWAITRQDVASFDLPKRADLERLVRTFRESITARTIFTQASKVKAAQADYPRAARELSQVLLGPVADRLGEKRLVIVADGVLQYVPFVALAAPQSFQSEPFIPLIVQHEIVLEPSASTLSVIRRDKQLRGNPDRSIAVIADGVYSAMDSRNPKRTAGPRPAGQSQPPTTRASASSLRTGEAESAGTDLPRLPYSKEEAEAILAMVPAEGRLGLMGHDATKAAVMSDELRRYRIVHFAAHTRLDDEYPERSSLVLSLFDKRGNPLSGDLRLQDMYNLKLSAELVVLSACETALGKDVKGEGLISMVRGFMYSGTPRVLASMWKVDDDATAQLMKEFYKQLLENKLTPTKAIQQAQIIQWRQTPNPFRWAAFQLHGEWEQEVK